MMLIRTKQIKWFSDNNIYDRSMAGNNIKFITRSDWKEREELKKQKAKDRLPSNP